MAAIHLTDKEKEMLEYYMSVWKRSEIADHGFSIDGGFQNRYSRFGGA